jgi:asparagine synthase (glutamine-hydrolysing)
MTQPIVNFLLPLLSIVDTYFYTKVSKPMQTAFEVILQANTEVEFQVFPCKPSLAEQRSLITFAQDPITKIATVLIGHLHYQDELLAHLTQSLIKDFAKDAALALYIFQYYGVESLQRLEGEFALVIFDPQKQCLLALRDPLGSYPLYWTYNDNTIRVSTNLRLLAQQIPQADINRDFLASFIMFSYASVELATEQTAFHQIQRILPGNLLALYPDRRVVSLWSWDWMQQIPNLANISPEDADAQFLHLLGQGIKERIQFEKFASHLSGGKDSSSVVCIIRELIAEGKISGELHTLSLVYQALGLASEKDYIQMVIDQGGSIIPHFVNGDVAVDFQWFTDDKIPDHDEPYTGLFHLAMEKVLVDVAQQLGITMILGGGGAELVAEGNRMHLADLIHQGHWFTALHEARQWAYGENASLWSILYQFGIEPLLPAQLQTGAGTLIRRGYGRFPDIGMFAIPPWILPDFARDYHLWDKGLMIARQGSHFPVERSETSMGLRVAAGNWASWYLGTPKGIRISHPFLDPRLVTFCLGLPRELREQPGIRKPLLYSAMRGTLPEPIRTRRFQPSFNDVYWTGLSRNLPQLEDMILSSQIDQLGIFDKQQLIQVMRQHAIGIGDARIGGRINASLAMIAWFDQTSKALDKSAQLPSTTYSMSLS